MERISKFFLFALVLVHLVLLVWGVLGFLEYFFSLVLWKGLQNPTFPKGMQFLHWLAITAGGSTFLIGYIGKWRNTPFAMSLVYTMMATLCAVQTLDMMTNPHRYTAMIAEYIAYLGISIYLFHSTQAKSHFAENAN